MKDNLFVKLLCSLPVILVTLYFIPFLGICLILFRFFIYSSKIYKTPIALIVCGLLITVPQLVNSIMGLLKIDSSTIPYLNTIISSDIYLKLLTFSKRLVTIGIVLFILGVVLNTIFTKLGTAAANYLKKDMQKDYEIRKENDLKMQEKREKAKNTHVVHCPYCGSDNMLTEQTGICKYCRRKIEYKN